MKNYKRIDYIHIPSSLFLDDRFTYLEKYIAAFRIGISRKFWNDKIGQKMHIDNIAKALRTSRRSVERTYIKMIEHGYIDALTGLALPKKFEEPDFFDNILCDSPVVNCDSPVVNTDSICDSPVVIINDVCDSPVARCDSPVVIKSNSPSETEAPNYYSNTSQQPAVPITSDLNIKNESENLGLCHLDSITLSQEVSCSQGKNITLNVNKETVIIKNIIYGTVNTDLSYKLLNLTNIELKQQNKETQNIITEYLESLNTKQIRESLSRSSKDTLAQKYYHNTLKL
jgi:hypothetical protein